MSEEVICQYMVHPAAAIFPMIPDAKLTELVEDIKQHGLLEPIVIHENQILDGRNRLEACKRAGVEPTFAAAVLNGHTPLLYVIAKNIHRRHLTTSQRSTIAARMLPMLHEEGKKRMQEAASRGGHTAGNGRTKSCPVVIRPQGNSEGPKGVGAAVAIAAKALNIGVSCVQRAAVVLDRDPEAFARIERGETKVNTEYTKVKGGPRRPAIRIVGRADAAAKEPKDKKPSLRKRNAAKTRFIEIASRMRGMCRGLDEPTMQLVDAALNGSECSQWRQIIAECIQTLRKVATQLRRGAAA